MKGRALHSSSPLHLPPMLLPGLCSFTDVFVLFQVHMLHFWEVIIKHSGLEVGLPEFPSIISLQAV